MKDMQTKIVIIGILLSAGIMLRAQDNGGCEDCPAFNAGGKVEVRGVKENYRRFVATDCRSRENTHPTDDTGREGISTRERK